MGKLLIIILLLITIVFTTVLVSLHNKSGDIADLLSSNMAEIKAKSLGNEALIYGIKQLSKGDLSISETEIKQAFQGFDVLDGTIDSIKYVISHGDTVKITSFVTATISGKETQYQSTAEVKYTDSNTFENILTTSFALREHGSGNSTIVGNILEYVDLDFEDVFGISLARMRRFADHDYTDPPNNVSPVDGITYIETTRRSKVKITRTDWRGSGILILDGQGAFELTGGEFEGIIWVEGGEFNVAGGTKVEGAIFVNDDEGDTYHHVTGNCELLYDRDIVLELLGRYNISAPSSSEVEVLMWNN